MSAEYSKGPSTPEVILKRLLQPLLSEFGNIVANKIKLFLDDQERSRHEDIKLFSSLARPGGSPVLPSCSDDDESDEQEGK